MSVMFALTSAASAAAVVPVFGKRLGRRRVANSGSAASTN